MGICFVDFHCFVFDLITSTLVYKIVPYWFLLLLLCISFILILLVCVAFGYVSFFYHQTHNFFASFLVMACSVRLMHL